MLTRIQNSWVIIHQPLPALSDEMSFWKAFSFSLIPVYSTGVNTPSDWDLSALLCKKPSKRKTSEFREIHWSFETCDHHSLRSLVTWVSFLAVPLTSRVTWGYLLDFFEAGLFVCIIRRDAKTHMRRKMPWLHWIFKTILENILYQERCSYTPS